MSIFNILYQQSCLEIFAKGHRQLVAEQRDRASRVSSKLSVPGYARVLVQNPDGSDSIQRIYTAPYLQYQQSDRAWKLYKALYPLLLIAGVILLILSMLSPSVLNSVDHINALEVFPFFPLLYLIYTMFYQIFAPRRMEILSYKMASKRMRTAAFIYGLLLIAPLAAMAAYVITNEVSLSPADVFCMAGPLLNAVLAFLLFGLETKRRCIDIPNELPGNMEIIGD